MNHAQKNCLVVHGCPESSESLMDISYKVGRDAYYEFPELLREIMRSF